jgi:hypothetical protein
MKLRNITLEVKEFGDLELIPVFSLVQAFSNPTAASDLSRLMKECFLSLRSIYGDALNPFWDEENSRLKLHSGELAALTEAATKHLERSKTYQSSSASISPSPAKTADQEFVEREFVEAVRDKVNPNPAEQLGQVVANQERQRRIEQLQQELRKELSAL